MEIIHIIAAMLAAWRLTTIVTEDRIFDPIRRRWPVYFWTCQRCVSVWSGVLCALIYWRFPMVNWPLAISATYILQASILAWLLQEKAPSNPNLSHIRIDVDQQGNINLKQCDFNAPSAIKVLENTVLALQRQEKGNGKLR